MARTKAFDQDAVLQKAMRLFWSKGYHATSAQDLVDALGISRSSLYDTYTDKHTLFVLALQRYRDEAGGPMIDFLDRADDVPGAVEQLFEGVIAASLDAETPQGCFMVNAAIELSSCDAAVAALVRENLLRVEDALCRALARGQAQGQISSRHEARALARYLFNTFSGLRVAARSGSGREVLEDVADVALAALAP